MGVGGGGVGGGGAAGQPAAHPAKLHASLSNKQGKQGGVSTSAQPSAANAGFTPGAYGVGGNGEAGAAHPLPHPGSVHHPYHTHAPAAAGVGTSPHLSRGAAQPGARYGTHPAPLGSTALDPAALVSLSSEFPPMPTPAAHARTHQHKQPHGIPPVNTPANIFTPSPTAATPATTSSQATTPVKAAAAAARHAPKFAVPLNMGGSGGGAAPTHTQYLHPPPSSAPAPTHTHAPHARTTNAPLHISSHTHTHAHPTQQPLPTGGLATHAPTINHNQPGRPHTAQHHPQPHMAFPTPAGAWGAPHPSLLHASTQHAQQPQAKHPAPAPFASTAPTAPTLHSAGLRATGPHQTANSGTLSMASASTAAAAAAAAAAATGTRAVFWGGGARWVDKKLGLISKAVRISTCSSNNAKQSDAVL